jgi:uncharacterized protein (TIGR02391 family)
MISLTEEQIVALPVDHLGLVVLDDLIATNEWNEQNYLAQAEQSFAYPAQEAISEAFGWLRARSLIARKPGQTADAAIFVTRTGRQVAADGPQAFYASERLQGGVHPLIEHEARAQFLIGRYELGVFASLRAVEVRVRTFANLTHDAAGVQLMNRAFGPSGPLCDTSTGTGEQEGMRALFGGAYAVLRNPTAHRQVDYDDVAEAAEAVQTASLLMRILDRIEERLVQPDGDSAP